MSEGVRNGVFSVSQVKSDDRSQYLNLDAGYGWLAAWFHAHEAVASSSAALLRWSDSGNYALVLYLPSEGIPEQFRDYAVIWQVEGRQGT